MLVKVFAGHRKQTLGLTLASKFLLCFTCWPKLRDWFGINPSKAQTFTVHPLS